MDESRRRYRFSDPIDEIKENQNLKDIIKCIRCTMLKDTSIDHIEIDYDILSAEVNGNATIAIRSLGCLKKMEYLIKEKKIKASIFLPPLFLVSMSAQLVILVLTNNNEEIIFVDLDHDYIYKSYDNLLEIFEKEHSDKFTRVKTEEVLENRSIIKLNPLEYFTAIPEDYKDEETKTVRLGTLINKVSRGIQIFSKKLKEMQEVSQNGEFDYKETILCLSSKGINDDGTYILGDEKIYVSEDEKERFKSSIIKNLSLVITRLGNPNIKTIVFNEDENNDVYALGNLIVIEFDTEKINPYYLQAMFMDKIYSEKLLRKMTKSSSFYLMSKRDIEDLMIPLPTMDIQNRIGDKYKENQDNINEFQDKIRKLLEESSNLFYENIY